MATQNSLWGQWGGGTIKERCRAVSCSWGKMTAGEILWPGFASRCCGQALGAGGAR
jgi:hypothetical protein